MINIIIIAVLICAALYALKSVVRAVLILAAFVLLLSLGCALWAHFSPESLEGNGFLFAFFAGLGSHIVQPFL